MTDRARWCVVGVLGLIVLAIASCSSSRPEVFTAEDSAVLDGLVVCAEFLTFGERLLGLSSGLAPV